MNSSAMKGLPSDRTTIASVSADDRGKPGVGREHRGQLVARQRPELKQ
jgi:hypothetical protein